MTDEECIATLLLHGGKLWWDRAAEENNGTHWMARYKLYFAIDGGYDEHSPQPHVQGRSPSDAARKYCERHGLLWEAADAEN